MQKSAQRWCKHCALAKNFRPAADPFPGALDR